MPGHELIVQGHRGCRAQCPENSIEGVREAVLLGAFAVEVDVRPTADAHFAVVHDPVAGLPYYHSPKGEDANRILFTPSSRVRRITFGHFAADGFPKQNLQGSDGKLRTMRIPLLHELLTDPALTGKRLNLELKNDAPGGGVELETDTYIRRFCAEIEQIQVTTEIWRIKSFDHELINQLRKVRPQWPLHYLAETRDAITAALKMRPEGISVRADLADAALVRQCEHDGVHLSVWTVNDVAEARQLYQMGVRDFVSDDPSLLLKAMSASSA